MPRILAISLMLALGALPASALTQLERSAQQVLDAHSIDVDVTTLRPVQVSAIHAIGSSKKSNGSRRVALRSVLQGRLIIGGK
ncbi:hypothetical protein [Actibacterium ureilyticum]|uniref:hypothetical protein n=1 Tax=Actibacterium ureilyticum TaxID=1590614 RepID=UPI000BAADAB4|nr:hypothetical protein [Actibacterium ureilyticum]